MFKLSALLKAKEAVDKLLDENLITQEEHNTLHNKIISDLMIEELTWHFTLTTQTNQSHLPINKLMM